MIDALIWFITVEILGLIALPVTFRLFKSLPDKGYAFGKALSILLVSFVLWILSSIHILPNTQWAIILLVVIFAAGSFVLFRRRRSEMKEYLVQNRGVIIATEAVFLIAFVGYGVIHAYNCDIMSYGEKPMDLAFLNGVVRSNYFPPNDPWLSGYSINYYYFGYLMMGVLTKLTGIGTNISFNLSLMLIYALTVVGVFSIVYNLVRIMKGGFRAAIGFGLVGVVFLLIIGNLEGVLEMMHTHGAGSQGFWKWVDIGSLNSSIHGSKWYPNDFWWWWRATRVINTNALSVTWGQDYTITEFPSFSFLFADLHPHVMSLPFVLLNIAVCLEIVMSPVVLGLAWIRKNWAKLLIFAVCLGALSAINTWDLPIYIFLFVIAALAGVFLAQRRMDIKMLRSAFVFLVVLVSLSLLLYLPYYLNLQTAGIKGIALVNNIATSPLHFCIFWGLLLFLSMSLIFGMAWRLSGIEGLRSAWLKVRGVFGSGGASAGRMKDIFRRNTLVRYVIIAVAVFPLLPYIFWAIWSLADHASFVSVLEKFGHILPLLLIIYLIIFILIRRLRAAAASDESASRASIFVSLLLFVGFMLLMGLELFYVRDPNGIRRMNTMFKYYYEVWVFLSIASAFGLYWIASHWRPKSLIKKIGVGMWWVFCALFIIGSLIYPIAATLTMTNEFSLQPTLDALAYDKQGHAGDYEAVMWLNSNVSGAPVIVEATGNGSSYYDGYFRISGRTGLPTVIGPVNWERMWRGSDKLFAGRAEDVDLIYTSNDSSQVQALLDKYHVTFVYVGYLERAQYGESVGDKFAGFMDVAYENSDAIIYRVREVQ